MSVRHLALSILVVAGSLPPAAAQAQLNIEQLIEQTGVEPGATAMRDFPGWRPPQKIVMRDIGQPLDQVRALLPDAEIVMVDSRAEAIANAAGADAVYGWCSEEVLEKASAATWVQINSAGADRCMSVERIANGAVVLTNMQKMSAPVIAEHVTAMILALARSLPQFGRLMETGDWQYGGEANNAMQSIAGKTLLVAGLGGIGTEVARRGAALGMRVVGTRRSSREGPDFVAYVGLADELDELAMEADFIVNALPLTAETTGLFDAEFFARARTGAHFINVGRGGSVVTADLVAALESGQLGGAGLDVTDPEPLPADHPLWRMDNVIITPHVAGDGGNRERHIVLLMENLRRFAGGEPLLNVVDPQLGY